MRKDLFRNNPQYNLSSHIKTAFRINLGIGLTMGLVTFGGLLGPVYPLLGDSPFSYPSPQKRLVVTKPNSTPEVGLSSNELIVLRDRAAQQDTKIALLNNEINALNAKIREMNRTLFAKDRALDNSKMRALHQKLQQKNLANAKLEQKIAALEAEMEGYRNKIQVNEVTVGSLSEMITILKENKEKMYAQHLDELHQMEILAKKERQKLEDRLKEYSSDDSKWKVALKQKKEELKSKEEHFAQALEEHNLSRQELQAQTQALSEEIEFLTAQLEKERSRQAVLKDEQNTWDRYSEELKQELDVLVRNHEDIQKSLMKVSQNAVAIDEDHAIYHVIQTYNHQNALNEHQQAHAAIKEQHENLKSSLDTALSDRENARRIQDELQQKIESLQQDLDKAYRTISTITNTDEQGFMLIAKEGADREDQLLAQKLLDAFRERAIRDEYADMDNRLAEEQSQRQIVQQNLYALALLAEDRETEIADWVNDWQIKVVKAELERDAALAKLQLFTYGQEDILEQLKNINIKYAEVEALLQKERMSSQDQLVQLEQQLALAQEENAHAKLDLNLENLSLMLQKRESDDKFATLQSLENTDKEIVNALELERDDALKSLAYAEERQSELIKQVDELSAKYSQIENELKQNKFSSTEAVESFVKQIQDLEETTNKLHEALENEKASFAQHKQEAEKQQTELSRLFEEARDKSMALEQELTATHARHNEELTASVSNLEIEREQAYKNLEAAEARKAELHSQFDELSQKYAKLEEHLTQTKSQHDSEIMSVLSNFEFEKEHTLRDLSNAEARQAELIMQLDELTAKYAEMEVQLKQKDHAANQNQEGLYNQIQELEELTQQMKRELSDERDSLASHRQEIQEHQAQLKQLSEAISNLEKERDDALNKLSIAEAQQVLINDELKDLTNKYDQVRRDFETHSQNAVNSSTEFRDQLMLLEAHSKKLEDELRHEKQAYSEYREEHERVIAALESEREAALYRAQVNDSGKEEALSSINNLRNKVIELENQLTQQSMNAQNVIQQLENQLETTRAALDEMHSTLMSSQDHFSAKEQKFLEREKSYEDQIKALEKEMADIQKFLDDEKKHWNDLQEEVKQVTD